MCAANGTQVNLLFLNYNTWNEWKHKYINLKKNQTNLFPSLVVKFFFYYYPHLFVKLKKRWPYSNFCNMKIYLLPCIKPCLFHIQCGLGPHKRIHCNTYKIFFFPPLSMNLNIGPRICTSFKCSPHCVFQFDTAGLDVLLRRRRRAVYAQCTHTSGQMRETYGFGTCRKYPTIPAPSTTSIILFIYFFFS